MSAITIIIGVVMLVPYLAAARMTAGHVAHKIAAGYKSQKGVPDSDDWLGGWICGLMWPVYLLVRLARAAIGGLFARVPAVGAERTHLQQRARRELAVTIAEAEKRLCLAETYTDDQTEYRD